jgi:hypothetical protein
MNKEEINDVSVIKHNLANKSDLMENTITS